MTGLIVTAWLALVALLAWAFAHGLRRALADEVPPPFFDVLDRCGVRLAKLRGESDTRAMASAVRRCALCGKKADCRAELSSSVRFGATGGWPAGCPNAAMIENAAREAKWRNLTPAR